MPLPRLLHGLIRVIFLPHTFFESAQKQITEDEILATQQQKQPVSTIRSKTHPLINNLSHEELEGQIKVLYEKVWLGLYQANAPNGPFRYDEIRALYHGAGLGELSDRESEIKPLNRLYFRMNDFQNFVVPTGINDLKLFPYQSNEIRSLMIEQLQAYESEIPQVEELYRLLQGAQVGLGQPAPDEQAVKQKYMDIAKPLEERLNLYDNRMARLKKEVYDESAHISMNSKRPIKGRFLYDKVFHSIMWVPIKRIIGFGV